MDLVQLKNIKRYDGSWQELTDQVIIEKPFTVYINGEEFVTMLCSPKALNYLALGFLFSEGIIETPKDIKRLDLDEEHLVVQVETFKPEIAGVRFAFKRTLTSGCGRGSIFYNTADAMRTFHLENNSLVDPQTIINLMRDFHDTSVVFKETGGVHGCALADAEKIICFHEDIGRHNALDKVIGQSLWEAIDFSDKLLLTSGRLSSEIVLKSAKAGIPYIISKSAPTELALKAAENIGITLVGFVRGKRFNVYTGFQRIK